MGNSKKTSTGIGSSGVSPNDDVIKMAADVIGQVNEIMNNPETKKAVRDVGITLLAKKDPRAAVILTGAAAVQDMFDGKRAEAQVANNNKSHAPALRKGKAQKRAKNRKIR